MAVGFKVGSNIWPIGSQKFLYSFFSTCAVRLEPDGWGSRFPALQESLYKGALPATKVPMFKAEMERVREELKEFKPSEVVWDFGDISAKPPWGTDISTAITDLSNYFVTQDGRDFFDVFGEAVDYAERANREISIESGV